MTRTTVVAIGLTALFWGYITGWLWLVVSILLVYPVARGVHWLYWQCKVSDHKERKRLAAIAARADAQHQQIMRGDPNGVYGQFPPATPTQCGPILPAPHIDPPPDRWGRPKQTGQWTGDARCPVGCNQIVCTHLTIDPPPDRWGRPTQHQMETDSLRRQAAERRRRFNVYHP